MHHISTMQTALWVGDIGSKLMPQKMSWCNAQHTLAAHSGDVLLMKHQTLFSTHICSPLPSRSIGYHILCRQPPPWYPAPCSGQHRGWTRRTCTTTSHQYGLQWEYSIYMYPRGSQYSVMYSSMCNTQYIGFYHIKVTKSGHRGTSNKAHYHRIPL